MLAMQQQKDWNGPNSLSGKRILITGANGYLGKNLIPFLLRAGAEVFLFNSPNYTSTQENEYSVDITDKETVKSLIARIKPQIIYHLAASLDRNRDFVNYQQIVEVNVNGTLNLLEALVDIDIDNFIFSSSSEVYGNQTSPFTEDLTLEPTSPYSLSKVYAEHLIRTFSVIHHKPYSILRLFNFYGPNMSTNFFIPQLISSLQRSDEFKMTRGEQYRDFLYIDDVIQGLICAAIHPNAINEIFNICSGFAVSLKEIALEVAKHYPDGMDNIKLGAIPYRANEIWKMMGDNTKASELLGFHPTFSLSKGIEQVIAQANQHQN